MQKVYCRSIRPDGYGEGVVPDMDEPNRMVHDELMSMKAKHIVEVLWNATIGKWTDHLASLPVLYLIHPDLAKVGWVGEYKEQLETLQNNVWKPSTSGEYRLHYPKERRIVLVPVEGKEDLQSIASMHGVPYKQPADKAAYKDICPYCLQYKRLPEGVDAPLCWCGNDSDKAEEKEVVSKTPEFGGIEPEDYGSPEYAADTYAMGEFNSHHFPQQYMIARNGYLAGLKSKPTPVTSEAVDYFSTWLKSEVATLSREVSMSKAMNGMFDKIHLQILHKRLTEVLDKYQLLKQQTTKP